MKRIGFLSFGHWTSSPHSQVRSASDALLQSIELAVAAEELGADGAYFRVHHFAQQLASPFPLLAAIGARTSRIEIGTAVIDMRYENPLYMAEDAGAADLIAGGRLQLGISRGSPEQVIDGFRHFGYVPGEGETDADMARRHAEVFLELLSGEGFAEPNPRPMFPNPPGLLRAGAALGRPARPDLVGRRLERDCRVGGATGHEHAELDPEVRREWTAAPCAADGADQRVPRGVAGGRPQREPRVSVSRSIFALVDDRDRAYFGHARVERSDRLPGRDTRAIFGRTYAAEPDVLVEQLAQDRPSPPPTRCC